MPASLRVIHCGTGLAGAMGLRAIIEQDGLELAGLLVNSESNVGRDAGSFCRLPDCGITATRDVDALVVTHADVVVYMLLVPNVEHICAFLASGKNVVTTAGFLYAQWNNQEVQRRLEAACEQGRSSFYSTGLNPGLVDEILPLTLSRLCMDWESIYIAEYAWLGKYPSGPMLFDMMGFGKTLAEIDAGAAKEMPLMTELFSGSVAALAHELGVELDEVRETRAFALTPKRLEIKAGVIEANTVAGLRWRWTGYQGGVERIAQETFWIVDYDLGEGWPESGSMEGSKWEVRIEGTPSVRCRFEINRSFIDPTKRGLPASGVATAMAAVNAVADVVAARPGVLLASDLPQPRIRIR
jgi:2,4-diaminopentanoate dehydrogenase